MARRRSPDRHQGREEVIKMPKIEKSRNFYQKKLGGDLPWMVWKFEPSKYFGKTHEEKGRMAHKHATQHANFYRELVTQGVYPKGTKVKVKKQRHSNSYAVEFWMPEVNPLEEGENSQEQTRLIGERDVLLEKIKRTARKYGVDTDSTGEIDRDTSGLWNYGRDKQGELRYFDTHILGNFLPFEGRKNLEGKVLSVSIFLSFIFSIFFLSPNLTGNIIGNFNLNSTNSLGIALFITFILLGVIKLKI